MSKKTLLIIVLLIAVVSSGSFFMFNVFDDVKTKYDPIYYLTIKNNDDTKLADIVVDSSDARAINYLRDFSTKEVLYVLFFDKGLKIFDVKENKIMIISEEKDYKKGEYFIHVDENNDVIGYIFKHDKLQYYMDVNSNDVSFDDTNLLFNTNQFGNYLVLEGKEDNENKYYLYDKENKEEKLVANYIESRLYYGNIYYVVYSDDLKLVSIYDNSLKLLSENIDKNKITYNEEGFKYLNNSGKEETVKYN